jgi:CYTH domain-containing protein
VDEFHSPHAGLILAEVELPTADHPVALPSWLGEEVTGNPAYYNSTLASTR